MVRQTGAENGQGWVKQLPLSLSNAQKWKTRRSKGPMAQSSSQASLRSLQRAEVEIGGVRLGPRMKANHKGYLKSIHAWKKESSTNTYLKK